MSSIQYDTYYWYPQYYNPLTRISSDIGKEVINIDSYTQRADVTSVVSTLTSDVLLKFYHKSKTALIVWLFISV